MTRTKAIGLLSGLMFKGKLKEALDMAIKALEQEPTTKNDLVHNICDSCTNIGCELQSGIVRTKCSFYMPSITPQEPKTGHWKHNKSNVICSNCGRGYKDAVGRTSALTYNYCPNCGAKMESEE